ncbi:MAG TPA: choice-of-anchor Q domain-containing protein, partial [Xanthomonadales bacterium]|nr:choice-of-anchor Q domain-containing protein [Xanthomonadales bacterium]
MQARNLPHPRIVERTALACALALLAASVDAGTVTVTHTGAASASTCTLGQAIYAANRANNPGNTTPSGATTIAPLSHSATTTIGVGTCTGATAGANTIQLPTSATINFGSDAPDNFWYGPNALPPIASEIVIEGRGATLTVTLGASPRLRFFYVGANPQSTATPGYNTPGAGTLTLNNLTLSGGRQQGGRSWRSGGGAGMGGAIFNQGLLSLVGVTLNNNQAIGGASGQSSDFPNGGGMGADGDGSRGGMGGPVPLGTSDAGANADAVTGVGGVGGGTPNGLGGVGGSGGQPYSSGGNGAGGGATANANFYVSGGGGGGFGGGPGGAARFAGSNFPNSGGRFGQSASEYGSGGGVGGGGAISGSSLGGGGGGFGGGSGASNIGGRGGSGGFGGGGSCGLSGGGFGGYGGGGGWSDPGCAGAGGGAGMGGAIFNHAGTVSIVNSTLAGNAATGGSAPFEERSGTGGSAFGGAIFNLNGSLHLAYSTIAGNNVARGTGGTLAGPGAAFGGAVFSLAYNGAAVTGSATAALTLENSILANSTGGVDLAVDQPATVAGGLSNAATATTTTEGVNFVTSTVTGGSATLPLFNASNPSLGPLANNGGPTSTMALLAGSPAIDAATGGTPPSVDQRGLGRPAGSAPDVGAFEFGAAGVAPQITSSALPNGSFGVPYNQTVVASGAPAPSFSISAGALPPGLTLDAGSGLVSGTPTSVSTSSGTITASNGVGTPATQDFEITIASVVPGAPTGVVATRGNASVSVAFVAPTSTGGSAIISYEASCGGQSTGGPASPIVVGNLTNGVAVTCTVVATNAAGNSAPSAASNSVTPATVPDAPTNLVATPGNGSASFQFNPPASNGGAAIIDYTVSCAPGNGQVTGAGSPLTLGGLTNGTTYACSVTARNGLGSGAASATVDVVPAGTIAITSSPPPNGSFGVPYSHTVVATGAPAPSFSVSAGALPPGLTLNTGSGLVSGTPTSVGTGSGTITADNGVGTPATQDFEITIAAVVPGAPTNLAATAGNGSANFQFNPPASNGGAAIIDYTVSCAPGNGQVTGAGSPLTLGGLTNGTTYACSVT